MLSLIYKIILGILVYRTVPNYFKLSPQLYLNIIICINMHYDVYENLKV